MPIPDRPQFENTQNKLILEEMNYDINANKQLHAEMFNDFNIGQKYIYESIIDSVYNESGTPFFVYGHGGTDKTFLWYTIIARLRAEGKIVLAVATSGIAALLLPGGRITHSRFRIPLDIDKDSTCDIKKKGTQLAKLILKTSLVIWDEAPMTNRFCFEALDRSLRDILSDRNQANANRIFGGITVALGGDFRHILPVIPKGKKYDVMQACLCSSPLLEHVTVLKLSENMRLKNNIHNNVELNQSTTFDKWLLQIGEGRGCVKDESVIQIPQDLILPQNTRPQETIVNAVFPNLNAQIENVEYIRERAILTPKNDTVHEINDYIIQKLHSNTKTYHSSDSICQAAGISNDDDILYPTEFLNSLMCSGMPRHELQLKVGVPIMLLRNLNQFDGLCNGTRLIVTHLGKWCIQATIITGSNIGDNVVIPRIIMSNADMKWPFRLKRRQLPIFVSFCMTINKSQGQSLKTISLYMKQHVFTHGRLYVALSRVTSRQGINILLMEEEDEQVDQLKNIVFKEVFNRINN